MESDWAGLPGFLFTLPLSALVVTIGLLPAIAGRYGHEIPIHMADYHFEYGFMVCAFLNTFILYPVSLLWSNRKKSTAYELPPPPPNNSLNASPR
jgi:hypothetical protein